MSHDHPDAPSKREREFPKLSAVSERGTSLPLIFIAFVLVALIGLPLLLQQRTRPLWRSIVQTAEPARDRANDVQAALALEMSALRGYVLTGEERFRDRYADAWMRENRIMRELEGRAPELGPDVAASYRELQELSDRWHAHIAQTRLNRQAATAPNERQEVSLEEALFRDLLAAAERLESTITDRISDYQEEIRSIEQVNFITTTVLVGLALIALGLVAWIARRVRALARQLRRLAEAAERRHRQAVAAMNSKAHLIRGISHDLKNPLGAVDGYAHLLELGGEPLTEQQSRWIGSIRRSVRSMLAIIDDLLELSRAEAGELRISPEPLDSVALVRDIAEDYRARAIAAGLTFDVDVPRGLSPIETDGSRVAQILGNLISNAVKYTPDGGHVQVAAATGPDEDAPGPGRWLRVDVRDTGPGIAPRDRERIFEEFFRVEDTGEAGAGIGLAISRRIARLLGGDITVRSEVGRGSTFTLWLPLGDARRRNAANARRRDG